MLVFDPYEILWISVMSCVHLAVLVRQKLVGHYTQTFQPNCFTPASLIGIIDFYRFKPLALTLTLPGRGRGQGRGGGGGSQGQCKAKPLGFIFSYTFQLIWMKFNLLLKQFKLNIAILFLSEIYRSEGNNCCFTDFIKCWHAFERLPIDLIQT